MSAILIRDLPAARELDGRALAAVRGGRSLDAAGTFGPLANVNVNVGVEQNLFQFQNVEVTAFNDVHIQGADFGPLRLNVNPRQFGQLNVAV